MKKGRYIALILVQLVSLLTFAQIKQFNFERIGTKQGLSDPMVLCLMQDSRGFIWVGTRRGLNRYDGHRFKSYYKNFDDSTALSNSNINKIVEDSKGNIWIATSIGLNKLDQKRVQFRHYFPETNKSRSKFGNNITDIAEDSNGKLWVATDESIDIFDPKTERFTRFFHDANDSTSISDDNATTVFCDINGDVWVGTISGELNRFVSKDSTFIHYKTGGQNRNIASENRITAVFEDSHRRLWVGTRGEGLQLFDREAQAFSQFKLTSGGNSPAGISVLCINEDDNGNLLVGIEKQGLWLIDPGLRKFTSHKNDEIDDNSLSANSVNAILKDHDGNIWVGLFAGGINLNRKSTTSFNHFKHTSDPGSLSNNIVLSIHEDHDMNLWVGTDGGGLNCFVQKTGKSIFYKHNSRRNSIPGDYILSLEDDREGNLWIGTWGDGLSKLNLKTQQFTNFSSDNTGHGLSCNNIQCIKVARDGKVWIGTFGGGLDVYDDRTKKFVRFMKEKEDLSSLSDNNVLTIIEDRAGKMWIGTANGGVNLYDRTNNKFIRFNQQNNNLTSNTVYHLMESRNGTIYASTEATGLNYLSPSSSSFVRIQSRTAFENEFIFASLEDDMGNIWMSSNKGISKFDLATSKAMNYSVEDGLQADEFKPHAAYKSTSGLLYFGGINGYNSFRPDQIIKKPYDPPIVFTDLLIFNRSVPIARGNDRNSPLQQDISETKKLRLNHDQTVITFEFASLDYATSGKKGYAYKLEGFDKAWNYVKSKNSATYTNLDPGDYSFKVRSQDNSIGWSNRTLSLDLTIVPPFWKTWWFRILMAVILLSATSGIIYWRTKRLRHQKELLEKLVEERTKEIQNKNELLKDLNSTKDKLFSIISHDLRSPFNSILGFQNMLVKNYSELPDEERMDMIRKSHSTSTQVYSLVENLLSWASIQSNGIQFSPTKMNIKGIILKKINLYREIALAKGIKLDHQIAKDLIVFADVNMLDTIFRNLIGNAIKFTPTGGSILVSARQENEFITVSIIDSGTGMTQDEIKNLYLLEKKKTKRGTNGEKGSGLGLVLCKELAEKNGGSIVVKSEPGKGSIFSVVLPASSK